MLEVLDKMCLIRYFELGVIEAVKDGRIKYPVYLSSGQEWVASCLSTIYNDCQLFTQHRAHDWYLAFGGSPEKLRDELLGLPTGTSGGRAGSNCLQFFNDKVQMYGHHGLIGENVSIGVGACYANRKFTICVFGDGAAEEDYVLSSIGFAGTHKLPVLFINMDNNLSIMTKKETRRSWNILDVAERLGASVSGQGLPAIWGCRVHRLYWHNGIGVDDVNEYDYYFNFREQLDKSEVDKVESKNKKEMEKLWGTELSLKPLNQ